MAAIEVEGARELRNALRKLDKTLPKELARIHKRIATPVAEKVRQAAPPGPTGRLARSVKAYGTQRSASVGAGARIKYAGVNNYGWPKHDIIGSHFLEDTFDGQEASMLADYEKELDTFIDSGFKITS
jgi:hypothetical protein